MISALPAINHGHRSATATATVSPDLDAAGTSSPSTSTARTCHGADVGGDVGNATPTAGQQTQVSMINPAAVPIIGLTAGTRHLHIISPRPVVFPGVANVKKNPGKLSL